MLRVIFTGNLGSDPEQRYTQDGRSLLQFRVAVNTRRRDPSGEWTDHTDWFRVRLMGARADALAERLHKGQRVFVLGALQIDDYQTREGERRTSLDVWADEVDFASTRSDSSGGQQDPTPARVAASSSARPAQHDARGDDELEDLPF